MVPLEYRGVARDPRDGAAVIILAGDESAALPVWVDDETAEQIERAADRRHADPPDDGAALAALVRALGGALRAARIRRGGAGVVGELILASAAEDRLVEVRASLAVAVALWSGVSILAEPALLDRVSEARAEARAREADVEPDAASRWNAWLEHAVRNNDA